METALRTLLDRHGGWLTYRQARQAGLDPHTLGQAVRQGQLERLQRGVYRAVNTAPLGHDDLLEVQLRFPHARPCLLSALAFHGLTVQNPGSVEVAVPRGRRAPRTDYPPLTVYTFTPRLYAYGAERYPLGAHTLTLYTPEKTLCDLLRFEQRLGRDLFLEGLKNYLRARAGAPPDLPRLRDAARACGVASRLDQALEVLLA